jgi:hypothetical protein
MIGTGGPVITPEGDGWRLVSPTSWGSYTEGESRATRDPRGANRTCARITSTDARRAYSLGKGRRLARSDLDRSR